MSERAGYTSRIDLNTLNLGTSLPDSYPKLRLIPPSPLSSSSLSSSSLELSTSGGAADESRTVLIALYLAINLTESYSMLRIIGAGQLQRV